MGKDILAFFGLVFLTILVMGAVALIGLFYDGLGIISLPQELVDAPRTYLTAWAESGGMDEIIITSPGSGGTPGSSGGPGSGGGGALSGGPSVSGRAEWSNPLDLLPTASPSPLPTRTPDPTATPVPPLEPQVYRGLVIARLKSFATALEQWLDANQRLTEDNNLLRDDAWRGQMDIILQNVGATGQSLASVGPAPNEYQTIDRWLKQVGQQAAGLQWNYRQALDTADSRYFLAAGENFQHLKQYLTQAVQAMVAAGWTFE